MTGVETAGITVAKLVIERAAPAGLARLLPYIRGKTIMIVGPSASGKTTFLNYLRAEVFLPVQPPESTLAPNETKPYEVHLGTNQTVTVTVKTTVDVPGQYTAIQLATEAFARRPHGLVVVLDLTNPDSSDWFEEFSTRLDQKWQGVRRRRNRLRAVVVAMNKADLIDDAAIAEQEAEYRRIAQRHWRSARGSTMDDIIFMRSIMVQTPAGTSLVDALVVKLVTALERKR